MPRFILVSTVIALVGCAGTPVATQQIDKFHICKANPNANFINEKNVKVNCADEMTIRKSVR